VIHTRNDFIRKKMNRKEFIGGLLAQIQEQDIRVFKAACTGTPHYVSPGKHLEDVVFCHGNPRISAS
jgi:hypothetical protein